VRHSVAIVYVSQAKGVTPTSNQTLSFQLVHLPPPPAGTNVISFNTVFTVADTVPNTLGAFRTVANPNAAAVIDTLSIVLTNAASLAGSNPMGLDTIVLTR
jgi:hypothetical protein